MSTLGKTVTMPLPLAKDLGDFLSTSWIELRRAERYHVFLSVARFELPLMASDRSGHASSRHIAEEVARAVRVSDAVAAVNDRTVVVLFPETSRQGAEVATRRIQGKISEALGFPATDHSTEVHKTPSGSFAALGSLPSAQLSSYPDAAGARSIQDFLSDIQAR